MRGVLGPSAVQKGAGFESWKGHRELGPPVAAGTRRRWENSRRSLLSPGTLWAPAPGLRALEGRGQKGAGRIRGGGGPTWDERKRLCPGPLNSFKCPPFPSRRSKRLFYRCLGGKKRNLHKILNNSLCYPISTWQLAGMYPLLTFFQGCAETSPPQRGPPGPPLRSTPVLHC